MFHVRERLLIQGSSFLFKGGADSSKEKDGSLRKAIVSAYEASGPQDQTQVQGYDYKPAAAQPQRVESIPGQQLYNNDSDKKSKGKKINLMRGGLSRI